MEKFELTLASQPAIDAYTGGAYLMRYERDILTEISVAIANGDAEKLAWFACFGDNFRAILMNVHEHRRALEFGFTAIGFNQYGWFASPKFLDQEAIKLGQSEIRIGHGPNGLWAYALSCTFGTAGSSGPLRVFCKKYDSRDSALNAALAEMNAIMSGYLGNSDTTNYKQDVLNKTLKAIAALQVGMVQLALF